MVFFLFTLIRHGTIADKSRSNATIEVNWSGMVCETASPERRVTFGAGTQCAMRSKPGATIAVTLGEDQFTTQAGTLNW